MIICLKCGKELSDDATTCSSCNYLLNDLLAEESVDYPADTLFDAAQSAEEMIPEVQEASPLSEDIANEEDSSLPEDALSEEESSLSEDVLTEEESSLTEEPSNEEAPVLEAEPSLDQPEDVPFEVLAQPDFDVIEDISPSIESEASISESLDSSSDDTVENILEDTEETVSNVEEWIKEGEEIIDEAKDIAEEVVEIIEQQVSSNKFSAFFRGIGKWVKDNKFRAALTGVVILGVIGVIVSMLISPGGWGA